jgi:hypothetical protein
MFKYRIQPQNASKRVASSQSVDYDAKPLTQNPEQVQSPVTEDGVLIDSTLEETVEALKDFPIGSDLTQIYSDLVDVIRPCRLCLAKARRRILFASRLVGIELNPGPTVHLLFRFSQGKLALLSPFKKRLECVELNPGPLTMVVANRMGKKALSETRYLNQAVQMTQKGKKKSKKQKASKLAVKTGGQLNTGISDYNMYRCVLSDPFSCLPVRLGGEMMQPSGIATLTWRGQITTSAAGNLSLVYYPWGINPLHVSTSAASNYTYTIQSGPYPGSSALVGLSPSGRVIASGLRLVTTSSATNNQGIVTIGCLPRSSVQASASTALTIDGFPAAATTTATQGFNEFFNYLQTESYPLKLGASAFFRPEDPLDYTFRDIITNGAGSTQLGEDLTPFIVAGVTGAAASSVMLVEIITHIEYTVTTGTTGVVNTGTGRMSQQGLIDSAKSIFSDTVDSTIQGVVGGMGLKKMLLGAGANLASKALSSAGNYFSNTNNIGLGY